MQDVGHIESPEKREFAERFRLNLFTLSFRCKHEESQYHQKTYLRSVYLIRIYLVAAILLYSLFGALDYFVANDSLGQVWFIRYGVVVPFMIGLLLTTKRGRLTAFSQYLPLVAILAAGFGIIAMTAVLPPPHNAQYYAGLVIVCVYTGTLVGTRFVFTTAATAVLLGTYFFVALKFYPIPAGYVAGNVFFLLTSGLVSVLSSYLHEYNARRAYVHQEQIEMQRQQADALLIESQSANLAKDAFLATMSHELRTPLNAICGFSEIIKDELFGPSNKPQYTGYARDIYQSGRHLLAIIDDILDLAKAEAGKLTLEESTAALDPMLQSCVRMCEPAAREGGVALEIVTPESQRFARIDERLIRQALLNLLSNALKFTPAGGRVRLTVDMDPSGGLRFTVEDNGVGIAPEDIERIRRPFEQVECAFSRNVGGTGLGLPLSEKIISLHGGTLKIESEIDGGTQVSFSMPSWRNADAPDDSRRKALADLHSGPGHRFRGSGA